MSISMLADSDGLIATLAKAAVQDWTLSYEEVDGVHTLVLSYPGSPLAIYFAVVDGGIRIWQWQVGEPIPLIPHTGIPPTLAVHGDLLFGDIGAIRADPMTYFIRAMTGIPASAVTQLFSSRNVGAEGASGTQKGAVILLAPQTGGTDDDGYITLNAYGSGSGNVANAVRFQRRGGANTVVDTGMLDKDGHWVPGAANTYDFGTIANRLRALHAQTIRQAAGSSGHDFVERRVHSANNAFAAWTTLWTITPSQVTSVWTRALVEMYAAGDTGGIGSGVRHSRWFIDIANGTPTVGIIGTDMVSGTGAAQLRLALSGDNILVQAASSDGVTGHTLGGMVEMVAHLGKPSGTPATFSIT